MRKFLLLVISLMTVGIALATVTKQANTTFISNNATQKTTAAPIAQEAPKGIIKANQCLNRTTTERTITLRNGKSVTMFTQTPSDVNKSSLSRAEEDVTPTITFTYPNVEGLDIFVYMVGIYSTDGGWGNSAAFLYEYFPEMAELYNSLPLGKYIAVSNGLWETEDNYGMILAHTYVDVTEDTEVINIDFTKCTNEITMNMEMPDGSAFPEPDWMNGECVRFTFSGYGLWTMLNAETTSLVSLADNFDEGAKYSCQCMFPDLDNANVIYGSAEVNSPFTGNVQGVLTSNDYKSVSQEFCLSEVEKSYGFGGVAFSTYNATIEAFNEGIIPQAKVSAQYAEPESDDFVGYALGVIYGYDEESWTSFTKMGGMVVDYQGKDVFVPSDGTVWYHEDGTIDVIPTVEALIHPVDKVCDPLFYCPLLSSGEVMFWYNMEDYTIAQISLGMDLMGAVNERTSSTNPIDCLKKVYVNGAEIDPNDLIGKELFGSKYEFEFEDSEFLMMNKYPFTATTTISTNLSSMDAEDTNNLSSG